MATGELRRHWRAVAVGFAMAFFAWGMIFYAHGVFKAALEAKHGWSGVLISNARFPHMALAGRLTGSDRAQSPATVFMQRPLASLVLDWWSRHGSSGLFMRF